MKKTWMLVLAVAISALPALSAGAEDEVLKAENEWASMVTAGHFDHVASLLDDTLIYAHSTGNIESKDEYLGKLRSGAQKYTAIKHEKTTIRLHGDAAVVHSIGRMVGTNAAGPFDNHLMIMHTWIKTGGQWRLAAHQTTQLAE
ncbi:MAG: nuclear transport factor 2 family protein [Acidobacteria bacterium]|nr:nuclear transport factor 2 family protein [Acidobacteriota bacterium]MDA1233394.1 nuclear transport factor 2 family protein [Acidobacteriota bacterium]